MQRLRKDKLLDTNEMKVIISIKFRIGVSWRKVEARVRSKIKCQLRIKLRQKNT